MEDKCMANMDESENARNKKLKKPQCWRHERQVHGKYESKNAML
jgi:hypothetical protein